MALLRLRGDDVGDGVARVVGDHLLLLLLKVLLMLRVKDGRRVGLRRGREEHGAVRVGVGHRHLLLLLDLTRMLLRLCRHWPECHEAVWLIGGPVVRMLTTRHLGLLIVMELTLRVLTFGLTSVAPNPVLLEHIAE